MHVSRYNSVSRDVVLFEQLAGGVLLVNSAFQHILKLKFTEQRQTEALGAI